MEHLKALTLQSLVIATSGSFLVASMLLSHGNKLGYVPLVLAVACGVGAFVKYRNR